MFFILFVKLLLVPAFVFGEQYRRTDGMLSLWSWDVGSDRETGNPIREDGESPALMRGELSRLTHYLNGDTGFSFSTSLTMP